MRENPWLQLQARQHVCQANLLGGSQERPLGADGDQLPLRREMTRWPRSRLRKTRLTMARPSNRSAGRASMMGITEGCADETKRSTELIDLDQRKVR